MLFVAFAEDRESLPSDIIATAHDPTGCNPWPVWDHFKVLFGWVDEGNPREEITLYNGRPFAPDSSLDSLAGLPPALRTVKTGIPDALAHESGDGNSNAVNQPLIEPDRPEGSDSTSPGRRPG